MLPSLGGRVWSLRHGDRELLFVNPVLRFANFGLTDGWFAGGIEWNLGSTGHWTLSSRPLHAARITTATGDGVRLWEWERTRDLVLQIDLALDGDRLIASTRVLNPDPEPKPLYYWTNIAVPETSGTRVLAPAATAWRTDYSGRLALVDVPHPDDDGVDISYPLRSAHAADYFFVSDPPGRFVAAVEPDGAGFAQMSTDTLAGRKLFLWGSAAGGARWQEWLSGPGARYAEIQAGRCRTQLEHDVIGAHEHVSWTEAFGPVDLAPDDVAAPFGQAARSAGRAVHDAVDPAALDARHRAWLGGQADEATAEILAVGSGWGDVELTLRDGEGVLPHAAIPFPPVTRDVRELPLAGMPGVSERWQRYYAQDRFDTVPWVRYARAVGAHLVGDRDRAEQEYRAAVDLASRSGEPPEVGAVRGLALLAAERGDVAEATRRYADAVAAFETERTLLAEAVSYLLSVGDHARARVLLDEAPTPIAEHGRHRLLRAHALLAGGDRAGAAAILRDLEVPDLAEGGRELDELWSLVHPGSPLPARLDFRMSVDGPATPDVGGQA